MNPKFYCGRGHEREKMLAPIRKFRGEKIHEAQLRPINLQIASIGEGIDKKGQTESNCGSIEATKKGKILNSNIKPISAKIPNMDQRIKPSEEIGNGTLNEVQESVEFHIIGKACEQAKNNRRGTSCSKRFNYSDNISYN